MAVSDRWHQAPDEGQQPCKCGRGRTRLYPSSVHLKGKRWQVRWRDPLTGGQKAKNFDLKDGTDRNRHADAFDKHIQGTIVARTYTDPRAGEITLQEYAETWRTSRSHGRSTAVIVESRLRNHVYAAEPGSARTPKGGVSIGQHSMALLAQRPTLSAAWIAAMPLADGAKRMVVIAVSAIYDAAVADGVIMRNPLDSDAVSRPGRGGAEVQPFTAAELAAIEGKMDGRYKVMTWLAAGAGMRQMEISGLGADDIHPKGKRPRVRVARQLLAVDGVLYFAPLKGGRPPRDVPLAKSVARALHVHSEQFPAVAVTLPWYEPGSKIHGEPVTVRLVVTRPDGTPLTRGSSGSAWETAVKRALAGKLPGARRKGRRIRGWNIHRGRHTAASAWLRAGIDVVRVASWLGDTVAVVTQTYAHLMPGDDGDADGRNAIDAFYDDQSAPDVHPGTAV